MTRWFIMPIWLILVLITLLVIMSGHRLVNARKRLEGAQTSLAAVGRDAQAIVDLRQQQERISYRERPAQDVIAQVNSVLAEAGIPTSRLKNLSPESDTTITPAPAPGSSPGPGTGTQQRLSLKKQSVRLVLESLTIQELGAFLVQWRRAQAIWIPTRLELNHVRSPDDSDNHYDVNLLISALYIADTASEGAHP